MNFLRHASHLALENAPSQAPYPSLPAETASSFVSLPIFFPGKLFGLYGGIFSTAKGILAA